MYKDIKRFTGTGYFCVFRLKIHQKYILILDKTFIRVYAVINPEKPAMENSTSFTARFRELPIVERRCVRMERMDS